MTAKKPDEIAREAVRAGQAMATSYWYLYLKDEPEDATRVG